MITDQSVANITDNENQIEEEEDNIKNNGKKQRVNRYCPKLKDIKFNLACEWNDCNEVFSDMDAYLNHIDNQHLNNFNHEELLCKWNQCDCIENRFDCESTFKRHVKFHAFHTKLKQIGLNVLKSLSDNANKSDSNNMNTSAPKCNLDEQTRNYIPELPYKFECSWNSCSYTTDNPELFYRHIKSEHVNSYPTKLTNGKCLWSDCDQKLLNKNRLVEHIRHHSQEKLVACPNCGALFSSFTKFIDHCSRSSKIGNLCFQCTHCNKKFSTNNLLREHIRKHINKCKCPICDMTCIDKNDLSKHLLYKHSTHRAFKCPLCDHTCKTQYDLQKHINLKHNERYEYQCNECEFKTKDLNNIKRHMLKFHLNGEGSLAMNDGQQFSSSYMCHVCNKIYCQGSTLSRHLKTQHNFQWPSGHSRFRYKLESDGYYRLQTLRYESIELVEQLSKKNSAVIDSGDVIMEVDPSSNTDSIDLTFSDVQQVFDNSQSINDKNAIEIPTISTSSIMTINNPITENTTLTDLTNNQSINSIEYNDIVFANLETVVDSSKHIDTPNQLQASHLNDYEHVDHYLYTQEEEQDQINENMEEKFSYKLRTIATNTNQNEDQLIEVSEASNGTSVFTDRLEFDFENFLNSNFQSKQQRDQQHQQSASIDNSFLRNDYKDVNLASNSEDYLIQNLNLNSIDQTYENQTINKLLFS